MSMLNLPKWKIFLFIAICFWGVFQAIPNFAPQKVLDSEIFKNSKTMKLGLDSYSQQSFKLVVWGEK